MPGRGGDLATATGVTFPHGTGFIYEAPGEPVAQLVEHVTFNHGVQGSGLVIYRVDGDGLTGIWAIRGHDKVGTEHLRPLN
jgi:hypothetical protein